MNSQLIAIAEKWAYVGPNPMCQGKNKSRKIFVNKLKWDTNPCSSRLLRQKSVNKRCKSGRNRKWVWEGNCRVCPRTDLTSQNFLANSVRLLCQVLQYRPWLGLHLVNARRLDRALDFENLRKQFLRQPHAWAESGGNENEREKVPLNRRKVVKGKAQRRWN
jgi:hypothetical protein